MKTIAIMLDGGFVLRQLYKWLGKQQPTADDVVAFASRCVNPNEEELFRIYFITARLFAVSRRHPILQSEVDFSKTATFAWNEQLLNDLALKQHVALRLGELSFDGWKIQTRTAVDIARSGRPISPIDIIPDLTQKRADVKIGLDVAWLASKRIVDRIALATSDSDFVPVMKFARREGVQVILVPMGATYLKSDLRVHADEVRDVSLARDRPEAIP